VELADEHGLAAVINIHDVALAKQFVERIVGLREGRVVFDGSPEQLTEDVLTEIYGEEDWSLRARRDGAIGQEEGDGTSDAAPAAPAAGDAGRTTVVEAT
jgi:phosphonate transport system ATP-binding protein